MGDPLGSRPRVIGLEREDSGLEGRADANGWPESLARDHGSRTSASSGAGSGQRYIERPCWTSACGRHRSAPLGFGCYNVDLGVIDLRLSDLRSTTSGVASAARESPRQALGTPHRPGKVNLSLQYVETEPFPLHLPTARHWSGRRCPWLGRRREFVAARASRWRSGAGCVAESPTNYCCWRPSMPEMPKLLVRLTEKEWLPEGRPQCQS